MINQGIDIPDNTIVAFLDPFMMNNNDLKSMLVKPSKKRDWFEPNFYNCLPLLIANQYGFYLTAEFDFTVVWNGGQNPEDVQITYNYNKEHNGFPLPSIVNHFGYGTITIALPMVLRTPKGVNLLTINPPNYLFENATVLSGSVETDQSRVPFTFNLKIHKPNIPVVFKAGSPISGFIPIPRYFADGFEIKNATEVFHETLVQEEIDTLRFHQNTRTNNNEKAYATGDNTLDRQYFKGKDPYGNDFLDHQKS
jgi:hypothetical protein